MCVFEESGLGFRVTQYQILTARARIRYMIAGTPTAIYEALLTIQLEAQEGSQ